MDRVGKPVMGESRDLCVAFDYLVFVLPFTLSLHTALTSQEKGNFCWSPYSVINALGVIAQAAAGRSRAELTAVLGDLGALAELSRKAAELALDASEDLPEKYQSVIAMANTLYADMELPVRPEFFAHLANWPGARVQQLALRHNPETSSQVINAEVAETTRGLISEIVADEITTETMLMLVNALYLKVAWLEPFEESSTKSLPFYAPDGVCTAPTMRLTDEKLGYAAYAGWQAVQLPAQNGVEALVLLPDKNLTDTALTEQILTDLLSRMKDRYIELYLPRFRIESQCSLPKPLTERGIKAIFTDPDFSELTNQPIPATAIVHQAVLNVDEQGIEGAAATAMAWLSFPQGSPLLVRVDRPFLFIVRHRDTGVPYFLAQVTHP